MIFYSLDQVPHFILKSQEERELAQQELLREYQDFLLFLLSTLRGADTLTLLFQSKRQMAGASSWDAPCRIETGYLLSNDAVNLAEYQKTRRFLKMRRKTPPVWEQSRRAGATSIARRVRLMAVGDVERAEARELLSPKTAPFIDFEKLGVGSGGFMELVAGVPLILIREKMRGAITGGARLAPTPHPLDTEPKTAQWRNVLATLMQEEGRIEIVCRRYVAGALDKKYATICQQYHIGTAIGSISQEELVANTSMMRAVTDGEHMYLLDTTCYGGSSLLSLAFVQDTDAEAFTLGTSDLRAKLGMMSSSSNEEDEEEMPDRGTFGSSYGRSTAPPRAAATQKDTLTSEEKDVILNYERFFTSAELVALLLPPYSLTNALRGIKNFVPKPFVEPDIETPSPLGTAVTPATAPILLGTLEDGRSVSVTGEQLTRHLFVTGASGAGKGNSMMLIVEQLHYAGIPTLIFDPAKRDFEPLMRKIGREQAIYDFAQNWKLRFNPFIPAPNVSLYSHCVLLAKSLSMLMPTNAVGYEMILNIIKDLYWQKLETNKILFRKDSPHFRNAWERENYAQANIEIFATLKGSFLLQHPRVIPTFTELLQNGLAILEARVSAGAQSQAAREALEYFERRWRGLERSALSILLTPRNPHTRLDQMLFQDTCLIELGSWFDTDEANAAFALIFAMMYEHQLSEYEDFIRDGKPMRLRAALLDEAHRIAPAASGGGDARLISSGKEVSELVGRIVAECRALNQILIFGEQSASKIDTNVLINTSYKLIHYVKYGEDKDFLGSTLSLSDKEQDFLSYLPRGQALLSIPEAYQPLLVDVQKWEK